MDGILSCSGNHQSDLACVGTIQHRIGVSLAQYIMLALSKFSLMVDENPHLASVGAKNGIRSDGMIWWAIPRPMARWAHGGPSIT